MLNLTFGKNAENGGVIISAEAYKGLVKRLEKIEMEIEMANNWYDILLDELDLAKKNEDYVLAADVTKKIVTNKIQIAHSEIEDVIGTLTSKRS